ncbi:hypothetical protein SZ64_11465 [Erythrobacter sp. SG61-1L]|uniref:hypothetical protein n=1 Tax=Erythrobacter sp. SG61-1L TaxID=1603897 RepID=UPI0006C92169|nr:hypothetical protein [Erythrobacter sp. SG61-1L]KPL68664.1 hypothetical protein SZ64_11465 [Erythrobacter sp. SG61-1L]
MQLRSLVLASAAAMAAFGAAASAGAEEQDLVTIPAVPKDYKPKTTPWGDPDLRGSWPIDHLNATPFQRTPEQGNRYYLTDEEFAQRNARMTAMAGGYDKEIETNTLGMGAWMEVGTANRRTSFLIDPANGRLPAKTAEGERRSKLMRSSYRQGQTFDWVTDFDSWDRCITRGLPASMFTINYNNGIRLWQAPGLVAIQLEMVHETRIVYTDGRPAISPKIGNWMGESRGHWEDGNTLVVETTNFTPGPSATNVGTWGAPPENDTPVSTEAKMTERFTMTGPNTIVYDVTWNDPTIFTAPWSARLDWRRNDDYQFYEYACHEGNVQVRGYISSSRAERAQKQEGANEQ